MDRPYIIKFNGVIMGKRFNKPLKPMPDTRGRHQVAMYGEDGIRRFYLIHRLVALEYLANPYNLPQINHKDEDPANNHISNLEWCTAAYNKQYSAKLDWFQVQAIRDACAEGIGHKHIAKYFNINKSYVSQIKRGLVWK